MCGIFAGKDSAGAEDQIQILAAVEERTTIGTVPADRNKNFKLMADVNLTEYTGTSFNRIGTGDSIAFTGVFDGNGCTISNFTYSSNSSYYAGIFGYIDSGSSGNCGGADLDLSGTVDWQDLAIFIEAWLQGLQ